MQKKKDELEAIYRTHVKDLYAYGMSCCSDEDTVKDAIHDIFLDIHRRKEKLAQIENMKHYLLSALRYRIHFLQKDRLLFREFDSGTGEESFESDQQEWIEREEEDEKKRRAGELLSRLNTHQREIVYQRLTEGRSFNEIAELMQMKRQSVQNLFGRAISKLRKEFAI
jgi:RNA polymerase sigma factor (sigma-70 family)